MLHNVEKIEQQEVHQKTCFQKFRNKAAVGGAAVTAIAVTAPAHAAVGVADLFTNVATELGGVSTGVLSVVTVLAGVIALLIGWSYVKKAK
ncbi:hypothetical protein BJD20_20040 [Acinetobacter proteolyticus]|uniref:hypothetical protein n=1 Tax=Acinetobacter proteolyticus TaxID=1776741 RepID=UPI00086314E3|nr:hypothetical protein [Acinetobacter proteolyticus]OEY93805.1 hypothetical protein BJD20_20040 [Acinetobacter proteolyticus]